MIWLKFGVQTPMLSIKRFLKKYGNQCHLCGDNILFVRPKGMSKRQWQQEMPSRDHVIPKSLGGSGLLQNKKPAHAGCNAKRGNAPIIYFRMKLALKSLNEDMFVNIFR